MLTKTTKLVLAPLADAVAQFVAISTEARTKQHGFPNVVPLSTAVSEQIANLVQVARGIPGDTTLKQELDNAIERVTKSSSDLLVGATSLARSPRLDTARVKVLESIQGILSGTTAVLQAVDDCNIRKIMQSILHLSAGVQTLKRPLKIEERIEWMQRVAQASVLTAQLVTKRVPEMLDWSIQNRLKAVLNGLRQDSPLLMSISKFIMNEGLSGYGKVVLEETCVRFDHICKEMEDIIVTGYGDDLNEKQVSTFEDYFKAISNKHGPLLIEHIFTDAQVDVTFNYLLAINELLKHVDGLSPLVVERKSKTPILEAISKVKSHYAMIEKIIKDDCRSQSNEAKSQLAHEVRVMNRALTALEKALNLGLIIEFGKLFSDFSLIENSASVLKSLQESAKLGEKEKLMQTIIPLFDFEYTRFKTILVLAKARVSKTNPQLAQSIVLVNQRLEHLLPAMASCSILVACYSKDENANEIIDSIITAWQGEVNALKDYILIQEGVFTAQELIQGSGFAMKIHTEEFIISSGLKDKRKTKDNLTLVMSAANLYRSQVDAEIIKTNDNVYHEKLSKISESLNTDMPRLKEKADRVLVSGEDDLPLTTLVRKYGDAVFYAQGVLNQPEESSELESTKLDIDVSNATLAMENLVIQSNEQPVLLSQEEAIANPIKAAGQELKVQASEWVADNNSIVSTIDELSTTMLQFSATHDEMELEPTTEKKSIFMMHAQNICSSVKHIAKASLSVIESCTDARLKIRLSKELDHLNSLAQQFKILSAVKVSSDGADKDAQMIICAKNITRCGKTVLIDCHGASLRSKDDKVRNLFREAMYKRRGQE